jgi:hypothetical protein
LSRISKFNFIRDIAPVASISRETTVMLVNPSFPAKTVREFVAYAKANPGKVNFASGGNGTPPHVVGELFKIMTGVNLVHVPYRGGAPAVTDLLGGQIPASPPQSRKVRNFKGKAQCGGPPDRLAGSHPGSQNPTAPWRSSWRQTRRACTTPCTAPATLT